MKYSIKICGITSENDLKSAQQLGANFVGFVLVEKSKRFINLKKLELLSTIVCKPLKIEFTKGSIFDSRTEIKLLVLNFVKLK